MKKKKLFIIRKYVYAPSAREALKLEKDIQPDDIWIDEDWRRGEMQNEHNNSIGFTK